ncbi:DUF6531 domain-containing protein [Fodinicola feengrottensis]|uniref:DUF6531 domain-containing protein n=1 Tax=Fodinicola feengrottensis TaxID=435914 RepID=UPI0013CFDFBA|nr:DUF6531 domain-containing protein [Fodinicola feengrottensis]
MGTPGQHARLTYAATANQEIGVDLTNNTTPYQPYLTITEQDGTVLWQNDISGHADLPPLPVGGTYTFDVSTYSTTGQFALKVSTRSAATTISTTGPTVVAKVASKGDSAQLKFATTKGNPLSVGFTSSTFPSTTTLDAQIIDSNGDEELTETGITSTSEFWFTPARTGQYKVQITPHDGKSTGSIAVTLSAETAGGTLATGVETTLSASRAGQTTRYTFAGTSGQKMSLVFGSFTFYDDVGVEILKPDGSVLRDVGTWTEVDLDPLPSTGTYQVIVYPYGETGSANIRIARARRAAPAATIGGAASTVAIGVLGGAVEIPFSASASERISVGMQDSDLDIANVRIIAPDDTVLTNAVSQDDSFVTATTTKSGTYRLIMAPPNGDYGSATFTLSDQINAGSISLNTAKTVSLPRIGQQAYLTFQGTAGQNLMLSFAHMTTKYRPYVEMVEPNGTDLMWSNNDDNPVAIGTLPVSGTYQLNLDPFGFPGSVTATLGNSTLNNAMVTANPKAAGASRKGPPTLLKPTAHRPVGGQVKPLKHGRRPVPVPPVNTKGRQTPERLPSCATCSTGTAPPPGSAPVPGGGTAGGDPVDLGTGLLADTQTDLTVPDVLSLAVTRNYQQSDVGIRSFGVGDSSLYDMFLYAPNGATTSQLVLPGGGRITYQRITPGGNADYQDAVFAAQPTPTQFSGSVLVWNGNGFDVRLRDGSSLVFGEDAPLQAIRDRYGNTITITRGPGGSDEQGDPLANGPLSQVTSPNGRWIKFSTDRLRRITRAQDNTGRSVSYTYDTKGHLATVTSPTGDVSSYTYDPQGRLATAKDGRGTTYLTDTYDSAGRVSTQTLGDGSTFQFAYTTDAADKLVETRLTDQRGNVRRMTFNSRGYSTSDTSAYGNPLAQTITVARDPVTNLPTSATDALGRRTDVSYDPYGNVATVTQLAGTSSARTESFTYQGPYDQLSKTTDWLARPKHRLRLPSRRRAHHGD